ILQWAGAAPRLVILCYFSMKSLQTPKTADNYVGQLFSQISQVFLRFLANLIKNLCTEGKNGKNIGITEGKHIPYER
ncbi:MAG TPA: hypothetical protein DDX72_00990, partial [Ruminococcaceae bacterium]|nr:hypothetical protein [Oscillospiraceae bacterium]